MHCTNLYNTWKACLLVEQRVSSIHDLNGNIAALDYPPKLSPDLQIFLKGGCPSVCDCILHALRSTNYRNGLYADVHHDTFFK